MVNLFVICCLCQVLHPLESTGHVSVSCSPIRILGIKVCYDILEHLFSLPELTPETVTVRYCVQGISRAIAAALCSCAQRTIICCATSTESPHLAGKLIGRPSCKGLPPS